MRWKDITSFLFKLSKEIIDEICDRREINFDSYLHEFEKDYEKAFDAFIEAIKLSLGNNTLLVLLDDLERLQIEILKGSINKDIFYFLNKLMETRSCNFIITASNKVFHLENEYKGSFLSNTIIKDVNFINKFDARRGLGNYLTRKIDDVYGTVEKIIKITGCQAHFIQIALDAIIKYIRKNNLKYLTDKDWKEINTTILESVDNELLNIWDNCLPSEKLVLSCLSNLDEKMTIDLDIKPTIKKELSELACLVSGEVLNETLKNLSAKSILDQIFVENEINYTFTIGLMKDWIKENKNPFAVISENAIQLLKDLSLEKFIYLDKQIKAQDKMDFFLSTIDFDRRRWNTLVEFFRIWGELSKGKEVGPYGTIEDNINELYNAAKFFCSLFGFSIEDTIDHPRLICFKFRTPAITLKKLRDLFLIIPKFENLDEAFYKALTGLIIDLDASSHVFLIMEFFESPVFRKFWMDSKLDLVLINSKDMKEILLSPNYLHSLLENVILKQVDLVQFSPYSTKGPAEDTMFFGRLPEIRRIERQSDKSFAIVGARQLGKTSLLLKVRNRIMDNKRIKTLYMDCEPYNDLVKLCRDISRRLFFDSEPINDLREFRSLIVDNCQKENIKVTLFLDEIDPILVMDRQEGELLFKIFRSLSQEGYLNLIIAGYETLFMVTKDVKSPFFNFLEVIRLSQLDFKSAAQLILAPMSDLGIEIQNKNIIVDEICKITACYPNLIQSICKRIVEILASEKRRTISELDIARTKVDREFQDYVVRNFYNPVSELGKIIILSLTDMNEFSPNDIDNKLSKYGIELSHSQLYNEIDNLCMLSILTRYGKKYQFTIPYLSVIFKNTMEIELELEKLQRDVKQYAN